MNLYINQKYKFFPWEEYSYALTTENNHEIGYIQEELNLLERITCTISRYHPIVSKYKIGFSEEVIYVECIEMPFRMYRITCEGKEIGCIEIVSNKDRSTTFASVNNDLNPGSIVSGFDHLIKVFSNSNKVIFEGRVNLENIWSTKFVNSAKEEIASVEVEKISPVLVINQFKVSYRYKLDYLKDSFTDIEKKLLIVGSIFAISLKV